MPHRDPDFEDLDVGQFGASEFVEEPGRDIWQRMSQAMEVLLYVLCLGVALKLFWPDVERQREMNRQIEDIKAVEASKQAQVAALRQKYELLKSDREFLETLARDRLDLAREGEYIIRIGRDEIPGAADETSE